MNYLADANKIKTAIIDTNDYLENKHLKPFIYSSLELLNLTFSKNDNIYVNYLYHSKQYQVYLTSNTYGNLCFEVFECFYNTNQIDTVDIFMTKDFFAVYIEKEFYYSQKISFSLDIEDLKEYIFKKLNVRVDNIYEINEELYAELKRKYENKKDKSFHLISLNEKKDYSLVLYSLYILFIFISSFVYLQYDKNNIEHQSTIQNSLLIKQNENLKQEHIFYSTSSSIINLFNYTKKKNIQVSSLHYDTKKVTFSFLSKNKNSIYDFLSKNKKYLSNTQLKKNHKEEFVLNGILKVIK